MNLLRRAPRTVYRVYSEDEYLDGDTQALDGGGRGESHGAGSSLLDGRLEASQPDPATVERESLPRPAALLGIGLLFAVAVSAAVLVLEFTGRHASRPAAAASAPLAPQRSRRPPTRPVQPRPMLGRSRQARVRAGVATEHAPALAIAREAAPPEQAPPEPASWRQQPSSRDAQSASSEFGFER
jgi:hypothetical protein